MVIKERRAQLPLGDCRPRRGGAPSLRGPRDGALPVLPVHAGAGRRSRGRRAGGVSKLLQHLGGDGDRSNLRAGSSQSRPTVVAIGRGGAPDGFRGAPSSRCRPSRPRLIRPRGARRLPRCARSPRATGCCSVCDCKGCRTGTSVRRRVSPRPPWAGFWRVPLHDGSEQSGSRTHEVTLCVV